MPEIVNNAVTNDHMISPYLQANGSFTVILFMPSIFQAGFHVDRCLRLACWDSTRDHDCTPAFDVQKLFRIVRLKRIKRRECSRHTLVAVAAQVLLQHCYSMPPREVFTSS